ncbi:hypothetical protein EVAR_56565_1 [Eumeta japonica]|uniref:Uncharacterized protein n=1 Tax=Eumeta variegata TaxID=151549 RepID=A0A4C1Z2U2_EUMVA|nr:hypothetical protein EVAR_56565_1 [Eumeta japonica]
MLRPVLRSHIPFRAKVALYKDYIRFRLTYAAPAWYKLYSASQRKRIQDKQNIALRMIVGAGRYDLNDVIARDLCIETVEEFIQRIARRIYIADQVPYEFLRNIAPIHERSPSGRPLPRELIKTPPPKNCTPTATHEAWLKYRSFNRLKTLSIIAHHTARNPFSEAREEKQSEVRAYA